MSVTWGLGDSERNIAATPSEPCLVFPSEEVVVFLCVLSVLQTTPVIINHTLSDVAWYLQSCLGAQILRLTAPCSSSSSGAETSNKKSRVGEPVLFKLTVTQHSAKTQARNSTTPPGYAA
ncbi:hypothetical protein Q8A73_010934 [Channa argus]|nr:hypothetical protein Q8A73_010934 [Channa argus]